jgi:hypothetical protein
MVLIQFYVKMYRGGICLAISSSMSSLSSVDSLYKLLLVVRCSIYKYFASGVMRLRRFLNVYASIKY